MEKLILTNIVEPHNIDYVTTTYNSKSPIEYYQHFSNILNIYGITILGFDLSLGWKGNSTKICFEYNNMVYNTFSISKLNRYCNNIRENGFKPPRGVITLDIINQRVPLIASEKNCVFIEALEFNSAKTKLVLKCNDCNLIWDTTIYDSFVNGKTCCPNCALYGFSQIKDGYFYIIQILDGDDTKAYKLGITNNLDVRMKQLSRATDYKIELFYLIKNSGSVVFNIEAEIKKNIQCNFLSETEFGDGWTETFSPSYIDVIFQYI